MRCRLAVDQPTPVGGKVKLLPTGVRREAASLKRMGDGYSLGK
jgi:hypothetical protein